MLVVEYASVPYVSSMCLDMHVLCAYESSSPVIMHSCVYMRVSVLLVHIVDFMYMFAYSFISLGCNCKDDSFYMYSSIIFQGGANSLNRC